MFFVQLGCVYLNFLVSYDGIGMCFVEGLLFEVEIDVVIDIVKLFGGWVSMCVLLDGGEKLYELNIIYFDVLKGMFKGEDDL